MNGDPNSDWDERSFKNEGMAYVDEKYVVMRHKDTDEPLLAINPDDGRVSWDPRFIDSDAIKKWITNHFEKADRDERRKSKGFGY